MTITLGHITYYEEYFSSRLKVVNGTDPETTAMINFDADVWKFEHLGLQPGMYKRIFKGVDGEMYFRLQPPRAQVSNHHFTRIRRRGESLF